MQSDFLWWPGGLTYDVTAVNCCMTCFRIPLEAETIQFGEIAQMVEQALVKKISSGPEFISHLRRVFL